MSPSQVGCCLISSPVTYLAGSNGTINFTFTRTCAEIEQLLIDANVCVKDEECQTPSGSITFAGTASGQQGASYITVTRRWLTPRYTAQCPAVTPPVTVQEIDCGITVGLPRESINAVAVSSVDSVVIDPSSDLSDCLGCLRCITQNITEIETALLDQLLEVLDRDLSGGGENQSGTLVGTCVCN